MMIFLQHVPKHQESSTGIHRHAQRPQTGTFWSAPSKLCALCHYCACVYDILVYMQCVYACMYLCVLECIYAQYIYLSLYVHDSPYIFVYERIYVCLQGYAFVCVCVLCTFLYMYICVKSPWINAFAKGFVNACACIGCVFVYWVGYVSLRVGTSLYCTNRHGLQDSCNHDLIQYWKKTC